MRSWVLLQIFLLATVRGFKDASEAQKSIKLSHSFVGKHLASSSVGESQSDVNKASLLPGTTNYRNFRNRCFKNRLGGFHGTSKFKWLLEAVKSL